MSIALSGPAPLISAYGQNTFEEFCINFNDELLHSYILRHTFENVGYNGQIAGDGITLPNISTMDNGACVELLRGTALNERAQRKPGGLLGVISKACSSFKSGKSGDHKDSDLLQEMASKFGVHASYIASPSVGGTQDRHLFGINHYAGSSTYDISGFVEKDADLLDSAYVSLLRGSSDAFVSKLFSGPSLAAEKHNKDENIIVQAQVSSRPLRQFMAIDSSSTPINDHPRLDPSKTYPVTTQLNFTLSELFSSLDQAQLWTISCIRPNDSSSPNSFDKRRVKNQIRSLLIPDIASRKSVEFVADYELTEFCDRYVPTMRGSDEERITQCVRSNGWKEGADYALGHRCIWLSYSAWKMVEDRIRVAEKERKNSDDVVEEDDFGPGDDATDYTHGSGVGLESNPGGYFASESADNLLKSSDPAQGSYAAGGLLTPNFGQRSLNPSGPGTDEAGVWSDWDKKSPGGPFSPAGDGERGFDPPNSTKVDLVVKEAPNAVEGVPTTRSRRWWLWIVWLTTWFMPNFVLRHVGRMKRPDVQLAWREKVTIFWLIFLLNATVIFYIIEFGRLLCPGFDKAWSNNEVAQHQGSNDFWISVQGNVYDVSNFVWGDHSDIANLPSNAPDSLDALAGSDMTQYFPPPLTVACRDLVTDANIVMTPKNFTALAPLAMHKSGSDASGGSNALRSDDWYMTQFLPKMKEYKKGPLVWDWKEIKAQAADQDIQRCVLCLYLSFCQFIHVLAAIIQDLGCLGKGVV